MKRFFLLTTLCCGMMLCFVQSSFAQLTTGESTASVIKTGNRPQAGDWGLFVGVSYSDFEGMFGKDLTFEGFPLVNFKRYKTDKVEYRLGLQFQGTTETISGDIVTEEYEEVYNEETGESTSKTTSTTTEIKQKTTLGTNRITPGIAYHFSDKNLLDVYVGANIPIGWNRDITEYYKDDYTYKSKSTPFTIGVGTFIGLQAFIADLPIAIGLEYGISWMKEFSAKTTITVDDDEGKEKSFTLSENSSFYKDYEGVSFDSLKSTRKSINNDIRVTLSYYFGNGK